MWKKSEGWKSRGKAQKLSFGDETTIVLRKSQKLWLPALGLPKTGPVISQSLMEGGENSPLAIDRSFGGAVIIFHFLSPGKPSKFQ